MSLLKRNSPRKTRAKKDQKRVGEILSPTLGPVAKKIPEPDIDQQKIMLDEYKYKPEPTPEPQQLNRVELVPAAQHPKQATKTFTLYDLSFFCEERIYNILWLPGDIKIHKIREIALDNIQSRLEVYSEYSREVTVGSFRDVVHFYAGEVLIPEEYLGISGFMRKYLKIEKVHVLYETGEILIHDAEYCNFWMERASQFFEPVDISIDSPKVLDKDVCLDCNLKCVIRHRQQMIN